MAAGRRGSRQPTRARRRVVGCTDMLAIAVQRVARVRLGGGRERCPDVGRRIEAPALVGVRRAELEGEAERDSRRRFVRVVLAVVAAQLCGRRQCHLPRVARASATQHNDALALGEAHTSRRGHRLLEHTPRVLRGVVHLYGAELMRVVCHIELAAHQKDLAAHRHGAR
eukprot:scaffold77566_cov63-Phaeocystis_antarctica.AAC.3